MEIEEQGMKVFNNVTDIVRDDMAVTMNKLSKVANTTN